MGYARENEVTEGDVLIADGGFTCIQESSRLVVERGADGRLFVPCAHGRHTLDGQLDEGAIYIGFSHA